MLIPRTDRIADEKRRGYAHFSRTPDASYVVSERSKPRDSREGEPRRVDRSRVRILIRHPSSTRDRFARGTLARTTSIDRPTRNAGAQGGNVRCKRNGSKSGSRMETRCFLRLLLNSVRGTEDCLDDHGEISRWIDRIDGYAAETENGEPSVSGSRAVRVRRSSSAVRIIGRGRCDSSRRTSRRPKTRDSTALRRHHRGRCRYFATGPSSSPPLRAPLDWRPTR